MISPPHPTAALLRDPRDETARSERQAAQLASTRLAKARDALASREFDRALSLFNTLTDACPAAYPLKLLRIEAMVSAAGACGDTEDAALPVTSYRGGSGKA